MERREFQTALGTVVLSGEFDGDRPLVILIRSAYAEESMFLQLANVMPEARILIGDIPGNRCPLLTSQTVRDYCAAYAEALRRIAGPKVICGLSLGGVIALGLRDCAMTGILAVDPPLRPANSAVLQKIMRAAEAKTTSDVDREFLRSVFLSGEDYFQLLHDLDCPTKILAGDHARSIPSVISDADLAEASKYSCVSTCREPGVGHSVWVGGSPAILKCLRELMAYERR